VRLPLSRLAALAVLAALVTAFLAGPVAGYATLIGANSDALATSSELLARYRGLVAAAASPPIPSAPIPTYPAIPESQATAMLQEKVKSLAGAAHVQVEGLQVLRSEGLANATRIGVRVRASGDTASLRALLYAIEAARPMLYPDNLQIQSHAASPDAAPRALDFQLDISAFKLEPAS
jgi:general secretion pathway protein M